MEDYKDQMIDKMRAEHEVNAEAIRLAKEAIKDRNHLNYLDTINIKRWEKANKEIEKNVNSLKG